MNSPAIKQNPDSWSALFASHLETVQKRSADALEKTGYDALLVHSGTPPLIFLDDHHLPFKAHAPFKVWAPLNDAPDSFVYFAPGKKPQLLVHQPVDYWHKSPELPTHVLVVRLRGRELSRRARRHVPSCHAIFRVPRSSACRSTSSCPGESARSTPNT